jgi:hypothetical protein
MRKVEIETKLNPDNLEMASQTKIWRSWYATTTASLKNIKKGFLDDCRQHGIREPDRIELITDDGLCTLLVEEISSYGVGFSLLIPLKPVATFEPERIVKKAPKLPKKPPAPEVEVVEEFDLTAEERINGWTPKTKADYMRRNLGVKPVYVGQ